MRHNFDRSKPSSSLSSHTITNSTCSRLTEMPLPLDLPDNACLSANCVSRNSLKGFRFFHS
jgi:hypothetical protein